MGFAELLMVALLTLLPGLELRLSILYGLSQGLDPVHVFLAAVLANILLGPAFLFSLRHLLPLVLKIKFLAGVYQFFVLRVQRKYRENIDHYAGIGLALFIAVPFPGTGSWSGALIAFLLGMPVKKFFFVNALGVLIAGTMVTLAGLGIITLFF